MTIDNTGKPFRGLPFPLRNPIDETPPADNSGVVTKAVADFFPVDMDEKINVVFNMSFNELTTFASAIDIGRDIGWQNSNDVYRAWIKSIVGIGGVTVSCNDVADCIESEIAEGNQTLINALTQNAISTGTGGNFNRVNGDVTTVLDRNPPRSLQENINPDFECDLNALWGGIRHGIVERLDDTARDLLEDLAAINDTPQRFQAFIDVIPVLGDLAEGIVTLATEVIPDILNLYNSYSSEAQLDEIACDLFAMVCDECRYPTHEELYNYYSTLGYEMDAMNAQTLAPLVQKIGAMISTFQPSSIVYHSMITFQLFTLYLQAEWNGNAGISAITKFARIGEDFGSDNWVDLCETCDEQYMLFTWDFTTQGQGLFYADTVQTVKSQFIPGEGWRAVGNAGKRFDVCFDADPNWQVRGMAFGISGAADTNHLWQRRPNWGSTTGAVNSSAGGGGVEYSFCYTGLPAGQIGTEYMWFASFAAGAQAQLTKVAILFDAQYGAPPGSRPSGLVDLCL